MRHSEPRVLGRACAPLSWPSAPTPRGAVPEHLPHERLAPSPGGVALMLVALTRVCVAWSTGLTQPLNFRFLTRPTGTTAAPAADGRHRLQR